MKISELSIGQKADITLVVMSATARETRAKKPYLSLEFFDGTDTIGANYWDWSSGNIPKPNTIVDVSCQVTEYMGRKQLTVKTMVANNERILADFVPTSQLDISDIYKSAYALMCDVTDDSLRTLATAALEELRPMWVTIPGAKAVHHAYIGGTLAHSYGVARLAKAIAENTPGANVDLAVVGGMLHDLGKLFTYKVEGVDIDLTNNGKLLEHVFIGAEFIGNFAETHLDMEDPYVYAKVRMLRHIILAHHGHLEYGSPVTPQCLEAYIVYHADSVDATAEQIRATGSKAGETMWTDRIYTLSNRPHITAYYTERIFAGPEETV